MKFREKLFIILSFFSFITPNSIVKNNALNNMAIILSVLCLALLIVQTIKHKIKIDYTFVVLILWRISILLPTIFHSGEIIKWGYQSVVFVGIYLLIKNYINNQSTIKIIYRMLFIYILINILVGIILPDGIFPEYGIHFLGIRTRFTEYSIALIYVSMLYYECFTEKNRKNKRMKNISIILAFINIFSQWIATGIIVSALIFIIYILLKKIKDLNKIYIFLFLILIIITINIINGNLLNIFSGLFEILNKDITLTGRTIIWNNAIHFLKDYFWIGYGYINDGNIIIYAGGLWQAHNTLLQSMCECGLIGTLLFLMLVLKQGKPYNNTNNKNIIVLNISVIFGFLIMMITEILYYYPIFIFVILLIGNSKYIVRNTKERKI